MATERSQQPASAGDTSAGDSSSRDSSSRDRRFAAADPVAWRARVEEELGVAALPALATELSGDVIVAPLEPDDRGTRLAPPGRGDRTRGARPAGHATAARSGLTVDVAAGDVAAVRSVVEAARADGADLLWLRTAGDASAGQETVRRLLGDGNLGGMAVVWDAGIGTIASAAVFFDLLGAIDASSRPAEVTLAVDPLAWRAAHGSSADADLAGVCRTAAALGRRAIAQGGAWRSLCVDTSIHRAAGASAADELAAAITTGLAYLRALHAAEWSVDDAAAQMRFVLSIGSDVFLEIAKLRALRRLWARSISVLGGGEGARAASVYARSAGSERTVYGRWSNQLRATAESFAALIAGADGLVVQPYDGSRQGRRLAVTAPRILAEEAHLGRVVDPAGGSGSIESFTDQLARAAWRRVRTIEGRGGMAAVLEDGSLAETYRGLAATRADDVAHGRERFVGVNVFPHAGEHLAAHAGSGTSASTMSGSSAALRPRRPTAAIEGLRQRVDALADGDRPRIALVGVGRPADHHGVVAFASRRLAVGGIPTLASEHGDDPDPAWATSGARGAVLCGPAAALREETAAVARWRRAGAATVLVATGEDDADDLAAAVGADGALTPHGDIVAALSGLLQRLGVALPNVGPDHHDGESSADG